MKETTDDMGSEFYCVVTTVDSLQLAERLESESVKRRLAACVQREERIVSTYLWKDNVETSAEVRLVFKTTGGRTDALMEFIKTNHSYEVPEIVVLPIVDGSPDYLNWIRESVKD